MTMLQPATGMWGRPLLEPLSYGVACLGASCDQGAGGRVPLAVADEPYEAPPALFSARVESPADPLNLVVN
jgi:hypothetical protein